MRAGVFLLDKPEGRSSAKALAQLKAKLDLEKVGHCGTLDPMATGLLVCVFGRATRLAHFVEAGTKIYSGRIRFGIETDSDDISGNILRESSALPEFEQVKALAKNFTGEIEQIPPKISAVKVNGERAYKLARLGEEISLKSRRVRIDEFRIEPHDAASVNFRLVCSKGTYVRSIARDLGALLGCGGCLESLRREGSSPFSVSSAKAIEDISFDDALPVEALLPSAHALSVSSDIFNLLTHGDERGLRQLQQQLEVIPEQIIYRETDSNLSAGLLVRDGDRLVFGCNF